MPKIQRMQACPNTPNCVYSRSDSSQHKIAPFPIKTNAADAMRSIATIIKGEPRTKILAEEPNYIHATFTSGFFKFVDDVEFEASPSQGVVHVRSASRLGTYDFGANRQRIEHLRALYNRSK